MTNEPWLGDENFSFFYPSLSVHVFNESQIQDRVDSIDIGNLTDDGGKNDWSFFDMQDKRRNFSKYDRKLMTRKMITLFSFWWSFANLQAVRWPWCRNFGKEKKNFGRKVCLVHLSKLPLQIFGIYIQSFTHNIRITLCKHRGIGEHKNTWIDKLKYPRLGVRWISGMNEANDCLALTSLPPGLGM